MLAAREHAQSAATLRLIGDEDANALHLREVSAACRADAERQFLLDNCFGRRLFQEVGDFALGETADLKESVNLLSIFQLTDLKKNWLKNEYYSRPLSNNEAHKSNL